MGDGRGRHGVGGRAGEPCRTPGGEKHFPVLHVLITEAAAFPEGNSEVNLGRCPAAASRALPEEGSEAARELQLQRPDRLPHCRRLPLRGGQFSVPARIGWKRDHR